MKKEIFEGILLGIITGLGIYFFIFITCMFFKQYEMVENQDLILTNQQSIILNQSRMMHEEDFRWTTKGSILNKLK